MPTPAVRVFLSYSRTKCHNPALVDRIIQLLHGELRSRKWEVSDPMDHGDHQSVRDKVLHHLLTANALIADCTASVPNVMYEIGFADALGYPVLALIDVDAFQDPRLREYFSFLKHDATKPLPADLGDLEYLQYSAETLAPGGTFSHQLSEHLDKIASRLSPGSRILSSSSKSLRHEVLRQRRKHSDDSDPPILRLLGGWLKRASHDLSQHEHGGFEIDSDYYRSAFHEFDDAERDKMRAIADLTDSTESDLWSSAEPVTDLGVRERTFLMPGRTLVDIRKLDPVLLQLRRHHTSSAAYSTTYVGASDIPVDGFPDVFAHQQGLHLLLIAPNVVGGYVKRHGHTLFRIASSDGEFRQGTRVLDDLRATCVLWTPEMSADDVRKSWLQKNRIGDWLRSYDRHVHRRDSHYFDYYDLHIRCWIPNYDEMLEETAERVAALARKKRGRPLRILEIGTGTGELTERILHHCARLLDPGVDIAYAGVDMAPQMVSKCKARLAQAAHRHSITIRSGTAWSGLPAELSRAPYDIICGSLVLHYILPDTSVSSLTATLSSCKSLLRNDGDIVFADSFAFDPQSNEEYWRQYLVRTCSSIDAARTFLDGNPEMTKTVTGADLQATIRSLGFGHIDISGVPGAEDASPFKILHVRA